MAGPPLRERRKPRKLSATEKRTRRVLDLSTDISISKQKMATRRKRLAQEFGLKPTASISQIISAKRKRR